MCITIAMFDTDLPSLLYYKYSSVEYFSMQTISQKMRAELPSLDYIAGIISCHGNFGWIKKDKTQSPFFKIKMHASEITLLKLIRSKLGLSEKIHKYDHQGRKYVLLTVHRKNTLHSVIIPALEFRLFGVKQKEFEKWKNGFYRLWLPKLYKN